MNNGNFNGAGSFDAGQGNHAEGSIEFFGESQQFPHVGNGSAYPRTTSSSTQTRPPSGQDDATSASGAMMEMPEEEQQLYMQATAFEGAAIVSMIEREDKKGEKEKALEITMEDGVTLTVELDSGEKRLIELGYTQELKRVLNWFQLYAIAISTMSVFAGVVPTYIQGFLNGGPVALAWYWWIGVFFVHLVGLSFAEISSSFPTAGSLYFWAAALAGPELGPIASFFTGWLEFIGLSVGQSGVSYAGVHLILVNLIYMCTGVMISEYWVFGMAFFVVLLCAAINLCSVKVVANTLVFSAIWQILGALVVIILLPLVAPVKQPASFALGYFNTFREITATPSDAYSFVLALIVSQYSLYGYDGVCHLAEETKQSDRTAPIAIMASISTISILGWLVIITASFSIQNVDGLLEQLTGDGFTAAPTCMYLQIVWEAFYDRYQSGLGAELITFVIYGSFFFGCIAGLIGASRVCYSLARDDGFPFARIWKQVNPSTGVPTYAVFLSATIGMLFLLPILGSPSIFFGINSIASIGWVGAYALPMYFRIVQKEEDFCPGPFYMADYIGVWGGKAVHTVAFLWVLYTVISFCLPTTFPINQDNFNWAPVAIITCLLLLGVWWVVDARHWFRGPIKGTLQGGDSLDVGGQEGVQFFES